MVTCSVMRRITLHCFSVDMDSNACPVEDETEIVVRPCGIDLRGKWLEVNMCQSCASGWSAPGSNEPA